MPWFVNIIIIINNIIIIIIIIIVNFGPALFDLKDHLMSQKNEGNVKLMRECFSKHSRMGTARMKEDKETEEGKKRRVSWFIKKFPNYSYFLIISHNTRIFIINFHIIIILFLKLFFNHPG